MTFVLRKTENLNKEMAKMSVSKPKEQWQVEEQIRNWLDLPSDVTANILHRIGVVDILENAQKVCTTWCKICKDPSMWRVIHMTKTLKYPLPWKREIMCKWTIMCKCAVDRSQGQLVDMSIVHFASNELLQYVGDRSCQLKRLQLVKFYHGMNWAQALIKFPMLVELNLYKIQISKEDIETAGSCCPMLRTLKLNQETCMYWHGGSDDKSLIIRNKTARAIGENLPEIRHLELIGNNMTNIGLQAILDGCCHLESLDLRQCLYIDLKGDLRKKCLEKIKSIKLPEDSVEGCLYVLWDDCTPCQYDALCKLLNFEF